MTIEKYFELYDNNVSGIYITQKWLLNNAKEIEKITDEWGEAYTNPANFESILRHATEKKI